MIEIIYDEKNENTHQGGRVRCELPKNIRQVGNAPGKFKIYIEDYVMTYLRKIAAPGNTACRGAILLGKVYQEDGEKIMFISGAVDAQNMEFDISMIKFSDSIWSGLYSEINKYFDELSVVGWFLSRMGFSTDINEQMKRLHRDNFGGDDKVLFLMDSLECEETFYYYDHGSMVREKGYYIYYVRNEKMQNYIISRKNNTAESHSDRVLIKDKTVVENFRQKTEGSREREKGHWGAAVASFALVCGMSLGALWMVSPESFKDLGERLQVSDNKREVQVFMNSGGTAASGDVTETVTTEAATVWAVTEDKTKQRTETTGSTRAEAAQTSEAEPETAGEYVVETGDTLVSISIRMYGTQEYADRIAEVNGMTVDEPIYEGDKLVIPYID